MKAYKVECLILNLDGLSEEDITQVLETTNYPNDCIWPAVMSIEDRDIGQWSDEHPLNNHGTMKQEYNRLFFDRPSGLDYPAAARVIALYLKDFCDENLPYSDRVAEAARRASAKLDEKTDIIITLLKESQDLKKELQKYRQDVEDAAGELMLPIPKPGTDMAKVMHVNRMLKYEIERLERRCNDLSEQIASADKKALEYKMQFENYRTKLFDEGTL